MRGSSDGASSPSSVGSGGGGGSGGMGGGVGRPGRPAPRPANSMEQVRGRKKMCCISVSSSWRFPISA